MSEKRKREPLPEVVKRWSETPSVNPRYKGATPADVARALMRKKPVRHARKES